jgi:hypothetical protein
MVWFGLTMVWPMVADAPVGLLSGLYPGDDGAAILQMGLGAFLAGAIPIVILSVVMSGLVYVRLRGRVSA